MEAKIRKIRLPGRDAHAIMTHKSRHEELKNLDFSTLDAKLAAVMVLLYPTIDNKINIALIRRNKYPGVHSNQIALPGGSFEEEDKKLIITALRETEEEIGVPSDEINVIKELTQLYIPPSNFLVQPYLGFLSSTPTFIPQESEVEEILEIELNDLLSDQCIQLKEVSSAYMKPTKVSCFFINNKVIWGATAMILSELRELFKYLDYNFKN